MSKHQTTAVIELESVALTMGLYLLIQLFLAFLAVRGLLGENRIQAAQIVSCGLSAFCGGRFAVHRINLGTMLVSAIVVGSFAILLPLIGLLAYHQVNWAGEGVGLLLAAVGGGILSGLLRRGKKHKKKRIGVGA